MTEDDTFNRLKGLDREQAVQMYDYFYRIAMDSPSIITVADVRDYIDNKLRSYGWTVSMLDDNE